MSYPEIKCYFPMDAQSGAHTCKYAYFEDITLALSVLCFICAKDPVFFNFSGDIVHVWFQFLLRR